MAYYTLQYVGGASATGTNSDYSVSLTSLTGGIDTAARSGDLVIVSTGFNSDSDDNCGVVSPSGYTEVAEGYVNDTYDTNASVSYKRMTGTPDTSVTVKGSTIVRGAAVTVHVWRGSDSSVPMDVTAELTSNSGSSTANPHPITPVTPGSVVVVMGFSSGGDPIQTTYSAAPSGYGNFVKTNSSVGSSDSFGTAVASKSWSGSGTEDPGPFTLTGTNAQDSWIAVTLAIRPGQPVSAIATDTVGVSDSVMTVKGLAATVNDAVNVSDVTTLESRRSWNNPEKNESDWINPLKT